MITSLAHLAAALQDAFEDEERIQDAKDAAFEVNRLLHGYTNLDPANADSEVAKLATAMLELSFSMLD